MKRRLVTPVTAVICLLLDQACKSWARSTLMTGSTVPFIPGFLQFTLTSNTGGAFSLGSGNNALMTLLVVAFVIGIIVWIITRERSTHAPSRMERFGMGFLLGGALGNLIDRLWLGKVTDFLDFAFITFPVFNVADVCIDIGLGLILICSYLDGKHASKANG